MDSTTESFQIPIEAAELYEERFVPALFAEWATYVVDAVDLSAGQSVLDVACGTGIVARKASERVGPSGRVVGVDLNEAMLTVAERVAPSLEWRLGDVAALPCEDAFFDAALCQMALMFFPDRETAVAEMARVLKPGGALAICVPAELTAQPAYAPFVEMVVEHAGEEARSLLNTYWSCGEVGFVESLVGAAELRVTGRETRTSTARFPSVEAFVATEVESTPLVEHLTAEEYGAITSDARQVLASYAPGGRELAVPLVGHVVLATRPDGVGQEP